MWHDLYSALLRLSRSPGCSALAALTLSLGIGVNAALLTVLDALLLRPLPYGESDRIAIVTGPPQAFVRFSVWGFEPWPAELGNSHAFASIGLYAAGGLNLGGEPSQRLRAAEVTPGFFEALGVRIAPGRAFTELDLQQTRLVVVIADGLWQSRFAADPAIVGQSILLNGRLFVISGVMPPRADFPSAAEVWIPTGAIDHLSDGVPWPKIVARLAPTVTFGQARDELLRIMEASGDARHPEHRSALGVTPIREALVGEVRPVLLLVTTTALLVLLVACINTASLLLVRVAVREREFAVRRALGASRAQLVRLVFCESFLLSIAGGIMAVLWAYHAMKTTHAYLPPTLQGIAEAGLDGRTFGAFAALSLLTTMLFGLAPAVSIPGRPSADVLRVASGATMDPFWRHFRSGLLIAEICVALVLLTGAVTIVQTVAELMATDLGARGTNALAIDVKLPLGIYGSPESVNRFYERFDAALRALPGIEEVGATNEMPGGTSELREALWIGIAEHPEDVGQVDRIALRLCATPRYFAALGVDLLAGRAFTDFDRPGSPKVAIVSAGYARALGLRPSDILGSHVNVAGMMETPSWAEVVGVVRDVRMAGPESPFMPGVYVPFANAPPLFGSLHVVLSSTIHPRHLVPAVRAAVARLDSQLPLYNVRTFDEIRAAYFVDRRLAMTLMLTFGGLAFGLAVVGLYGVVNYLVQLRTRDIAIRMAIGASPSVVRREILASGVLHATAGIAIGFPTTFASWALVSAYVPRLGRLDAMNLGILTIVILAVAVAATWLPAGRATRIDPVQALRRE